MSTTITTNISVTCDGPSCAHDVKTITWDEQAVQTDPNALPDDAYRLIILTDFVGNKRVFFKPECLRDFMRAYVPPLSPREKQKQDENNLAVEAARQKDTSQIEIDPTKLRPATSVLPGKPAAEVINGQKVGAITPALVQAGNEPQS